MDRYSRFVFLLKVLLPLMALALLSSVFLLSRNTTPAVQAPFDDSEIQTRSRGQQITGAYYASTTAKGEEVTVMANEILPGQNGAATRAKDVSITMALNSGGKVVLNSIAGQINLPGSVATFEGDAVIATDDGIRMRSDLYYTALDRVELRSPGPVNGIAVLGQLDAGQMEVSSFSDENDVHILFTKGVKLVYDPKKPER